MTARVCDREPRMSLFRFRLSEAERERLDEAAVYLETTPSEVAREGMLMLVDSVLIKEVKE